MKALKPDLPRSGPTLMLSVELSAHAVERFAVRGGALNLAGREPRQRLTELVADRGVVVPEPPAWFQGDVPAGGCFITIDDAYLLPCVRAKRNAGIAARSPWVATTFVAYQLAEDDLAAMTGEHLARMIEISPRAIGEWDAAVARHGLLNLLLTDAIVDRGRASSRQPAVLGARPVAFAGFYVSIGDGITVAVSRASGVDNGPRFLTVAVIDERSLYARHGHALAESVDITWEVIQDFRALEPNAPDDSRGYLTRLIVDHGRYEKAIPSKSRACVAWDGPVVAIADTWFLEMSECLLTDPRGISWIARHCYRR